MINRWIDGKFDRYELIDGLIYLNNVINPAGDKNRINPAGDKNEMCKIIKNIVIRILVG